MATSFDPFRLDHRPEPEPVEGPLPPHLWLVEDDDEFLETSPSWWVRCLAAVIVTVFLGTMFLSARLGFPNGSALVPSSAGALP